LADQAGPKKCRRGRDRYGDECDANCRQPKSLGCAGKCRSATRKPSSEVTLAADLMPRSISSSTTMSTTEHLPNPSKRDWGRILHGLARVGITYAEVGAKCNRNASTVANWAAGGDPKDSDARVVLALYAKHLP